MVNKHKNKFSGYYMLCVGCYRPTFITRGLCIILACVCPVRKYGQQFFIVTRHWSETKIWVEQITIMGEYVIDQDLGFLKLSCK